MRYRQRKERATIPEWNGTERNTFDTISVLIVYYKITTGKEKEVLSCPYIECEVSTQEPVFASIRN